MTNRPSRPVLVPKLATIESLLAATVAGGMIGGRHRPNVELEVARLLGERGGRREPVA